MWLVSWSGQRFRGRTCSPEVFVSERGSQGLKFQLVLSLSLLSLQLLFRYFL